MFETAILKLTFMVLRLTQISLSLISIGLFARSLDHLTFTRYNDSTSSRKLVFGIALNAISTVYCSTTFLISCFAHEVFFRSVMVLDVLVTACFGALVAVIKPNSMPFCALVQYFVVNGEVDKMDQNVYRDITKKCNMTRAVYGLSFSVTFFSVFTFVVCLSEWYMQRRDRIEKEHRMERSHSSSSKHSESVHHHGKENHHHAKENHHECSSTRAL